MHQSRGNVGVLQHRHTRILRGADANSRIAWSDALKCWCVFSPSLIVEIFRNKDYQVIDYRRELSKIAHRMDIDFSASHLALDFVPLAHEEDEHRASRKGTAEHITKTSAGAIERFAEEVIVRSGCFVKIGVHNLTEEFFSPVVDAFIRSLSGVKCPLTLTDVGPSQIFDRALGINRRKTINKQLEDMQQGREPGINVHAHGRGIALSILGHDALLGALQESFVAAVIRDPDCSLSSIAWPNRLIETGVPYVERRADKDAEIDGQLVRRGDRLRLFMAAAEHGSPNAFSNYFGGGRHKCLGEPLSQKAWHILTAQLAKIATKVRILCVSYKPHDFVFNCPIALDVEVYE